VLGTEPEPARRARPRRANGGAHEPGLVARPRRGRLLEDAHPPLHREGLARRHAREREAEARPARRGGRHAMPDARVELLAGAFAVEPARAEPLGDGARVLRRHLDAEAVERAVEDARDPAPAALGAQLDAVGAVRLGRRRHAPEVAPLRLEDRPGQRDLEQVGARARPRARREEVARAFELEAEQELARLALLEAAQAQLHAVGVDALDRRGARVVAPVDPAPERRALPPQPLEHAAHADGTGHALAVQPA